MDDHPPAPPSPSLWLVRHGESTWNVAERVQGQREGAVLTARGREQAEALAATLGMRLRGRPLAALYASDLARARQTAGPLAAAVGVAPIVDPALRERAFGVMEGGPSSALTPAMTGIAGGRVVDVECRPSGGESLAEVLTRTARFLARARVRHPAGDLVVVAHGGTVRTLALAARGRSAADFVGLPWGEVPNAGVLEVSLDGR